MKLTNEVKSTTLTLKLGSTSGGLVSGRGMLVSKESKLSSLFSITDNIIGSHYQS